MFCTGVFLAVYKRPCLQTHLCRLSLPHPLLQPNVIQSTPILSMPLRRPTVVQATTTTTTTPTAGAPPAGATAGAVPTGQGPQAAHMNAHQAAQAAADAAGRAALSALSMRAQVCARMFAFLRLRCIPSCVCIWLAVFVRAGSYSPTLHRSGFCSCSSCDYVG